MNPVQIADDLVAGLMLAAEQGDIIPPIGEEITIQRVTVPVYELEKSGVKGVLVDVYPATRASTRFDRQMWQHEDTIRILVRLQMRRDSLDRRQQADDEFVGMVSQLHQALETYRPSTVAYALAAIATHNVLELQQRAENNLLIASVDVNCVSHG